MQTVLISCEHFCLAAVKCHMTRNRKQVNHHNRDVTCLAYITVKEKKTFNYAICNFLLGLVDQLRHVLLYRFPLVTTVTRNKILNHYSFEALTKINKEHMQFDSLSYPRSKLT